MNQSYDALEKILEEYTPALQQIDGRLMQERPAPGRWSKKEIIGHLVDSAQNNLRRFIVSQHEDKPHISYRQDDWVEMNGYNDVSTKDLIQLWYLLNRQIITVLKNTAADKMQSVCVTDSEHTIEYLAHDYNKHLLHHLHQILEREPVNYP